MLLVVVYLIVFRFRHGLIFEIGKTIVEFWGVQIICSETISRELSILFYRIVL